MCDGWSSLTRQHIINFLVYCNSGSIFHKSIDASNIISRTAKYYFRLLDKVINEIEKQYVVQVVTDNASVNTTAASLLTAKRPSIFWNGCAAHCLDLMLEDIGKLGQI